MTEDEAARLAYNAYGHEADWIAVNGDVMPAWKDLGPRVRRCWVAAARALTTAARPVPPTTGPNVTFLPAAEA